MMHRFTGSTPSECPRMVMTALTAGPKTNKQLREEMEDRYCKRTIQQHINDLRKEGKIECVVRGGSMHIPIYRIKKVDRI